MVKFEIPKLAHLFLPRDAVPVRGGWYVWAGGEMETQNNKLVWQEYLIYVTLNGIKSCVPGYFKYDEGGIGLVRKGHSGDLRYRCEARTHFDDSLKYFAFAFTERLPLPQHNPWIIDRYSDQSMSMASTQFFEMFFGNRRYFAVVCNKDSLRMVAVDIPNIHRACISRDGQSVLAVDRDFTTVTIFDNPLV